MIPCNSKAEKMGCFELRQCQEIKEKKLSFQKVSIMILPGKLPPQRSKYIILGKSPRLCSLQESPCSSSRFISFNNLDTVL